MAILVVGICSLERSPKDGAVQLRESLMKVAHDRLRMSEQAVVLGKLFESDFVRGCILQAKKRSIQTLL